MKKIKMIKFYTGVQMTTGSIQSWAPAAAQSDKVQIKNHSAEVKEFGVEVSDEKTTTFVPWSNVVYIQYHNGDEKPAVKK